MHVDEARRSFAERPALFEFTYGSCGDCSGADACVCVCVYMCMCVNVPGKVVVVSDGERFASIKASDGFPPTSN